MKQLIAITTALLILVLLFTNCKKKEPNVPNQAGTEYFPNTVGDYWEYDVYDSSRNIGYTVTVKITGIKTMVDGIPATVWQYKSQGLMYENYIRINYDSIKVYDEIYSRTIDDMNYPRKLFITPFINGGTWVSNLFDYDFYSTISDSTVTTNTETFYNCFNIYNHYLGPNMWFRDNYWFTPNIGMVKKYLNESNFGSGVREVWKLKKYILK